MDNQTANDKRANTPKKSYSKPQIQEVQLRPEEAVLGGCKTSTTSGNAQATCNSPGPCSSLTS